MSAKESLRARDWCALALALLALNAALTFHNVWPTVWIAPRPELSVELGALLLALVAWKAFDRPLGKAERALLTLLVLALVLGRYAEVTAPALYGRPINLYWDGKYVPKVAAMLVEAGPWPLGAAIAIGLAALFAGLIAGIAWCLGAVGGALEARPGRYAVGGVAAALVGLYALGHWLDWPVRNRYSLPVSATYWQQARFIADAVAAPHQQLPNVPLPQSNLGRIEGDDVLLMFLESYGAVTYDVPELARRISPARDELARAAAETGLHIVSAFVSSPTFAGGSWLAHASFMSGVEVRDSGDYESLLEQDRITWPKLFKAAGYRAAAVMPGLKDDWLEGSFYGFDAIHGELALDYRGPEFGWWRIPDQFSLARAKQLMSESSAPWLVFLPTINTHIPFLPAPPYQADWQRVLDPDPYPQADVEASLAATPDWSELGEPYTDSFDYTFTYLAGYLRDGAPRDETLVLIGDHQPAASVSGVDARWDVPVHVITRHAGVAQALLDAGFVQGVALAPRQPPIATMPELSALLLQTFDAPR